MLNSYYTNPLALSCISQVSLQVFIFDLDQTLINNCPRTVAIFKDFARHVDDNSAKELFHNISEKQYEFSIVKMMMNAGIVSQELISKALKFWMKRFFSNEYLSFDVPLKGAVEYVNGLYNKGAIIVYLTARDENRMKEGTLLSLQKLGFPIDHQRSLLLMKQDEQEYDHESKKLHLDTIEKLGSVFAVFENDPKNLCIIIERFPRAISAFMTTGHLEGMGEPPPSSISLNDFSNLI